MTTQKKIRESEGRAFTSRGVHYIRAGVASKRR
jgi:hypothetical protein